MLDEDIASSIIYHLIQTSKTDYFSYLTQDSESLKTIYEYFIKLRANKITIEEFNYKSKAKQKALKELFGAYKKYLKANRLIDMAGVLSIAIKNISKYLKEFDSVYVDSFKIQDVTLYSSKQEEELLNIIKKNKLSKSLGRPRKKYDNTLYQNFAFNSYDEVRVAIKIAKKLMIDGANESDIIIVSSDTNEYLPYYYNLLGEYDMMGYDTRGIALNTFSKNIADLKRHENFKVQKAYWKYEELYTKITSLSKHLNLAFNKEKLQTKLMQNSMVRVESKGILFTDPNKFISLQDRFKHIIFIGSDITHFPPKSKDNFLYSQTQAQKMFYTNNVYNSSQTLYDELKRLSDNLYIITATYKGKRKLSPSIILDKNISNVYDVSEIQSRDDILKSSKRIESDELEAYQKSIISTEFTSFDGRILDSFTQGNKLSASALNSYQNCPMQYYFSSVLKLNAPQDKQDGFDAAQRGSLMHLCFELFVNKIKKIGLSETDLNQAKLYPIMLEVSKKAYTSDETQKSIGKEENINHRIDLSVLQNGLDTTTENRGELAKFVDYFIDNKFDLFKNSASEELFMLDKDFKSVDLKGLNPHDENDKEELKKIDEEHRFIKGFIDRLDNLEKEVNIIDYKSSLSKYTQKTFKFDEDDNLKDFQLGIYMLYATQKYPNKSYNAHLLSFKDAKYNTSISIDDKIYDANYASKMKQKIKEIQVKINSGEFSFNNSDEKVCEFCNYRHICHQAVLNKDVSDVK